MKTLTMSFGASLGFVPPNPDRTAKKSLGNWDVVFQTWPSRKAMAVSIRMQQRREHQNGDWVACVSLQPTEGY